MFRFALTALAAIPILVCGATNASAQSCRVKHIHYISGATLTGISTQFNYRSGTLSFRSSAVALGHGEPGYLFSKDDTSCVKNINGGASISYQGQNIAGTFQYPDAPDGYCYATPEVEWELSSLEKMGTAKDKKSALEERLRAFFRNPKTKEREELKITIIPFDEFERLRKSGGEEKDK